MAAALALVPSGRTLFHLEEDLLALLDSEDLITEEQAPEFYADLGGALAKARDKRDHVAQFLAYLESQMALAQAERERLARRHAHLERVHDHLDAYVLRVIEQLGPDGKGKLRALDGNSVTMSARGIPSSVEILDEEKIPSSCRRTEIKLPSDLFEQVLDSIDFELRDQVLAAGKPKHEASKTAIMQAIETAVGKDAIATAKKEGAAFVATPEVPGARIAINRKRLVRS